MGQTSRLRPVQTMASLMRTLDDKNTPAVLGVILARAGSVGLPNKHLLPLLGRPVIDYTFDAAVASRLITRLVVTTDCPYVTALAQARRIEAIARPGELAGPEASVQD